MTARPRRVAGVPDAGELRDWAAELVDRARAEGVELTGDDGLLTALVRQVLQTGLEVEMTDHLGYERHDPAGRRSGNSRNGHYPKTVKTEIGEVDLRVPRDRDGSFEPATVRKGQRRLDGLAGNVISLYAKGMTTGGSWSIETVSQSTRTHSATSGAAPLAGRECQGCASTAYGTGSPACSSPPGAR